MKIGILTLPLEVNYGGILQAFALQTVLRGMGHEVYTIDRHTKRQYQSFLYHVLGFCRRVMDNFFRHKRESLCWNPFMSDSVYLKISANTRDFVKRNMTMTRECFTEDLADIDREYRFDAYVVGSDQVWLPSYYPSSFLDFVERPGVLKVIYAASCGKRSFVDNPFYNPSKTKKLISEFSGVSVREVSLRTLCSNSLGVESEFVLDPTLLLSPENYLSACGNVEKKSPTVFSYILDMTGGKKAIVDKVSQSLGIPSVFMNAPKPYVKRKDTDVEDCVFPPVEKWITELYQSQFVVTDSFHGTVFAILFNKPFITIANPGRGIKRFESILGMLGLKNRMVGYYDESVVIRLASEKISFEKVNFELEEQRRLSIQFLETSLMSDSKKEII